MEEEGNKGIGRDGWRLLKDKGTMMEQNGVVVTNG